MKLHELDWLDVLRELPRWEALSAEARRAFTTIRPGKGFTLDSLGKAGREMERAGLLVAPTGAGTVYGLDPALRPLLIALRAAQRLSPLLSADGRLTQEYLRDQLELLQARRISLRSGGHHDSRDPRLAADTASSAAWLRDYLLAAESQRELTKWEHQRLTGRDRPRLVFPPVAQALRAMVQTLAAYPRGIPLRSLPGLVPDARPGSVAAALAAGLRYLLVFVSVSREAEAVVGLLPAVAARLAGPLAPPQPVAARETFTAPFHVGDMTALLVEAAAEPIAIRAADHTLYVRAQRAIAARVAAVPGWVDRLIYTGAPPADDEEGGGELHGPGAGEGEDQTATLRVELAASYATLLGLAVVKRSGSRIRLEATQAGRGWLAHAEGERVRQVLATFRALPQRNPTAFGGSGGLDFFGASLGFQLNDRGMDARAALCAAFLSVPPGALVPLGDFTRYHARENNPYLGPGGPRVHVRSYWHDGPATAEAWEELWANLLLTFLARRLVPLGCATLARTQEGEVAFGLTDAGRFLLGETDRFELPPESGGEVVVQPDFEIVFLSPAPRAEAELARLAERKGSGVGALFRLTRASVLRAAEQGVSAAQLLETLESVSRSGVPGNVARQVRDWMKAVRTIRIAPAVLVDCPDAETAGRVMALAGKHVTTVTPTLLRLEADTKTRAALVKRLREKGIFVGPAAGNGAGGTG